MKKRVLLWLIALFRVLYGGVYALLKLLPVQRKVVMISRQSNKLRPDFEQIGAALARRDPSVRIVYLCRMIGDTLPAWIGYGVHLLHCGKRKDRQGALRLRAGGLPQKFTNIHRLRSPSQPQSATAASAALAASEV